MMRNWLFLLLFFVFPCNAELSFFNAVTSSNQLGEKLYAQLKNHDGNFAYSPYSITTLLSAMYFTSINATKISFEKSLQFSDNQNITLIQFSRLLRQMKDPRLTIASSVWLQSREHKNKTEETVKKYFGPLFHNVDFKRNTQGILQEINTWADKQSGGKIAQLLNESNLDPDLNLLLIDLCYLKAPWRTPFSEESTIEELFYIDNLRRQNVKMMHLVGEFAYSSSDRFFLVELPLAIPKGYRKEISFYFLLPKVPEWLLSIEQELSAKTILQAARGVQKNLISLTLPSIDISQLISLKEPLEAIGLIPAFLDSDDFSKLSLQRSSGINKFFHVAPLSINESGTETSELANKPDIKKKSIQSDIHFIFNRPFLFFAIDKGTGIILLMGRIIEP